MKTRSVYKLFTLAVATVSVAIGATAQTISSPPAITLYNDVQSDTDYGYINTGAAEIGNEITLSSSTNLPDVLWVSYFFFAPNGLNGSETATVRIYRNDGAVVSGDNSPGTPIYNSGPFSLAGLQVTAPSTLQFVLGTGNSTNLTVTQGATYTWTWTIQFSGINPATGGGPGTGESAGLTIADPAETGQNYPSYWQNTGSGWTLVQANPGDPSDNDNSDFGAEIFAAANPTITWSTPSSIDSATKLSATQLDASSGSAPGTLTYSPASGSYLSVGTHTLTVVFTPSNPLDYNSATQTVNITVTAAGPGNTHDTPLLPEWATAAFTLILLGFGLKRVQSLRRA